MLSKHAALALGLCLVAALSTPTPVQAQEERNCEPSDVSTHLVIADNTVPQGDPVRMTLVAKNTSGESCTMGFPSSRGGTVRVFKNGALRWEHGYCRAYTQEFAYATWEPGHRETYRYKWKQHFNSRDQNGNLDCEGARAPAKPGTYSARGIFFGTDPDTRTARVEFKITG